MPLIRCRDCGKRGREREDDIAPELCPRCFDARCNRAFAKLTNDFFARGVLPERAEVELVLQGTGMTERGIHDAITHLEDNIGRKFPTKREETNA